MPEDADHMVGFELARPTRFDARLVMDWRNDPVTLSMFYHHEPKEWPAFLGEYRAYFSDPRLAPVFVLADGQRVGFLRFEPPPADRALDVRVACGISINIAAPFRGRGHGVAALKAVRDLLLLRGVDDVYAEVRVANDASCRAFETAKFELIEEVDKVIEDTKERCRIRRYRARLTSDEFGSGGVFVVAEAGSNWRAGSPRRDRDQAFRLIDVAVESGADAVKFQTYRPETVYAPGAGESDYLAEAGIRKSIHEIFSDLAMPYTMVGELADYCRQNGITFMSTPFGRSDFEAIDPYVSMHKIASYEISHLRLLELAAASGKPLILSTGASVEADIVWAVDTFRAASNAPLCLMQCTAKYPAPPESLNLRTIPWLRNRFGVSVGLSDHSRHPTHAPVAAVVLGAVVIEKHFTLNNDLPGPDHAFALTPPELRELVEAVRTTEQSLGSGVKEILTDERELAGFARRGIQALTNIGAGDTLAEEQNIAILRPGKQRLGVHPRALPEIVGRVAVRDIPAGDGLQEGDWT